MSYSGDDGLGGMTEVYSDRPRAVSAQVAEECEDEIAHRNRQRARLNELEATMRILKARVQARDIIIAQLKAQIRELQGRPRGALLALPSRAQNRR